VFMCKAGRAIFGVLLPVAGFVSLCGGASLVKRRQTAAGADDGQADEEAAVTRCGRCEGEAVTRRF
jgi:hypothetical protein